MPRDRGPLEPHASQGTRVPDSTWPGCETAHGPVTALAGSGPWFRGFAAHAVAGKSR